MENFYKHWWHQAVVYQIYPRSFYDLNGDGIGDLQGIIAKLNYLAQLGINVIWLSPIYPSPNDDNGYDISDYCSIHPDYGTMQDFEELVQKANQYGIKIVMDLVVNHTSDEHPWFIESKRSKDNPKRDWYIWRDPRPDGSEPNNWSSHFARSAWELDKTTGQYYLHLFSKKQPDLNWANPELRQAIYEMMHFWLKKGIGGFRMDVINMIGKPSDLPDAAILKNVYGFEHWANNSLTHQYLREMNTQVLSQYDILTVGETPHVTPFEGILYSHPNRHELGMIFQFEHMEVDKDPATGGPFKYKLSDLKAILNRWQNGVYGNGWNSNYWSNHDQARAVSRFGDDGLFRLQSAKMLGTTLHMMFGTPYVYQGEELGLKNTIRTTIEEYDDLYDHHKYDVLTHELGLTPQKAMAAIAPFSRDNARVPMSWSDATNGGFTTGKSWLSSSPDSAKINAEQALHDPDSVYFHYQKLIRLRRNSPYTTTIVYGQSTMVLPEDESLFAYIRHDESSALLVVSNFTGETIERSLDYSIQSIVLSNYENSPIDLKTFKLRPYESIIYSVVI